MSLDIKKKKKIAPPFHGRQKLTSKKTFKLNYLKCVFQLFIFYFFRKSVEAPT